MQIQQPLTDFKGDASVFKIAIIKKEDGSAIDITGWKILAEIGDSNNVIKKATSNVPGGGASQILIKNAELGLLEIYIDTNETIDFSDDAYIEIANFTDGDNKDTLYGNKLILTTPKITWETK